MKNFFSGLFHPELDDAEQELSQEPKAQQQSSLQKASFTSGLNNYQPANLGKYQCHSEEKTLCNPEYFKDALLSLWTVQDLIRWIYTYLSKHEVFFGHGYNNAWDEARVIVFNRLHLPYDTDQVYLLNSKLTEFEKQEILEMVKKRVHSRTPLAYLINSARFLNRDYYVDERVIIPRSPIGELIDKGFVGHLYALPNNILDMCTGSGVLALAMAEKFPEAQIDAVDISADALDVAHLNLELMDDPSIEERIAFIESDLFENVPEGMTYDLIVSNPPYVDEYEIGTMPAEFHHEPEISLGSGTDGLELTSRILVEAPKYLNPQGTLIVEVGNSRWALEEALPRVPFTWIEFERGGHGVFSLTAEQLNAYKEDLHAFMMQEKANAQKAKDLASKMEAQQTQEQKPELEQSEQ